MTAPRRRPVWATPEPPTPDPVTTEMIVGLGFRELLVNESSWVHRRVETIEFLDDRTVRRQMSVDLTLPDTRLVRRLFAQEGTFVPLTMFRKEPLRHLDVWTDEGRRLPVLTAETNGRLGGTCLFGIARNVVPHLTPAVAHALRQVPAIPPNDAEYLLGCMLRTGAEKQAFQRRTWIEHCWDDWNPDASLRALVAALDLDHHRQVLDAALASSTLRTLLTELASQFVLAASLQPEDLGRRQVIKFAYDEHIGLSGGRSAPSLYSERTLASFGFLPTEFNFTGLAIGKSESHHVEVVAPDELEIAKLTFDGAAPAHQYRRTVESIGVGQRAHAHLGAAPRPATGTVTVEFRAARAGLVTAAPLLAALVLGALILLAAHAEKIENDAAAAMLLVVPGVIAALIVRPGEHRLAARLLLGVRALVMGSSICAFVATIYIATGFKDDALQRHLVPLVWITAGVLGLLFVSYLMLLDRTPQK